MKERVYYLTFSLWLVLPENQRGNLFVFDKLGSALVSCFMTEWVSYQKLLYPADALEKVRFVDIKLIKIWNVKPHFFYKSPRLLNMLQVIIYHICQIRTDLCNRVRRGILATTSSCKIASVCLSICLSVRPSVSPPVSLSFCTDYIPCPYHYIFIELTPHISTMKCSRHVRFSVQRWKSHGTLQFWSSPLRSAMHIWRIRFGTNTTHKVTMCRAPFPGQRSKSHGSFQIFVAFGD